MSKAAHDLGVQIGIVNDLLCAVSVLNWDNRVTMPPGGAATRGMQIATLKGMARDVILSGATQDACEALLSETRDRPAGDLGRRAAEVVKAAIEHHQRIDPALLRRQAELCPVANATWVAARANSDFAAFRPVLEESVSLAREMAAMISHDGHPYSAMADLFEPGETAGSLQRFFGELRGAILPILDAVRGRPAQTNPIAGRRFPIEAQRAVCHELAGLVGYDFTRGRLDIAVHPFEVSFTRNDVRITTRYREDFLQGALFGTLHEAGHGLYEQGLDEALTRTVFATDLRSLYAVGGTSFGAHESQSRLWENHVGRSPAFWRRNIDRVRAHFPGLLDDVLADVFCAEVNRVEPGFIRVEADELTYDLHIMIRVEIEMALMDGSLAVADIPGAWNDAVRDTLGLTVPDEARGCLQDVHWSSGYIGSFPTYSIGNAMAAQLMEALHSQDDTLDERLEDGDYAHLKGKLGDAVWRHGRSRTRDEILIAATGQPLSTHAYRTYLERKFLEVSRGR